MLVKLLFCFDFAQWGDVGTDNGHPGLGGAGGPGTVGRPAAGALSATVIGGDEECGIVAIAGCGLDPVPEFCQQVINGIGLLQVEIIAALVGVLIGLAKSQEEDARLVCAEVFACGDEGELIITGGGMFGEDFVLDAIYGLLAGRLRGITVGVAAVDGQLVALAAEDIGKYVPGAEGGHFAVKLGFGVEVFEYVGIGIILFAVGGDKGVGGAGEDFVVARVRDGVGVGYVHFVLVVAVAVELALAGDGGPAEWHQQLPAAGGGAVPIERAKTFSVGCVLGVVEQVGIGACK